MRTLLVLLTCCGICFAADDRGRLKKTRRIERRWQRIQQKSPRLSVRGLFDFALETTALDLWPERVETVLDMAINAQHDEPDSRVHGNFKWYWGDDRPVDRNAVEFCMLKGSLLRMHYRQRLSPKALERLEKLMRRSVDGIRRHRVSVSYTNIYLMKIWNCIAIGEQLGMPDLADEGYGMLDAWLVHTWENGISEYLSPCYYGVDLDNLGLIAKFARREEARRAAETALKYMWADVAANWFTPSDRLGGAHSRDYDYLTGHSLLDRYVRRAGWTREAPPEDRSAFADLCWWPPPESIADLRKAPLPRFVHQRWGLSPRRKATQYVGEHFSVGSAGAAYGGMDKVLTVNLPGGPRQPVINFVMDARGDPYGKKRHQRRSGHRKSHHVIPFIARAQRGPEVLMLASAEAPGSAMRLIHEATCMLSHLVIPNDVDVWIGSKRTAEPAAGEAVSVPDHAPIFLRYRDVGVAVRFLLGHDADGDAAPIVFANDGKYDTLRLTCKHTTDKPNGRYNVALWLRAADGLDDAAFSTFRKTFSEASPVIKKTNGRLDIRVPGIEKQLRVAGDLDNEMSFITEGEPEWTRDTLLAVNGRDYGREILKEAPPVARFLDILKSVDEGEALTPGDIAEAEGAALILSPFRVDEDASASGGKFVWMPGETGGKGGSNTARATWFMSIPKAGKYYLWGRVIAPTSSDDSFFVNCLQDGRAIVPNFDWHTGSSDEWHWRRVTYGPDREQKVLELPAGLVRLEFRCREDGSKLDAIFLTDDKDTAPGPIRREE